MRRLASCSPDSRWPMMESISSMNIVDGAWYSARSKSTRTSFSDSPRHLLTIDDAEILKKVVLHCVATAFASIVFPVPGGPYKSTPFHPDSKPVKSCGYFSGITTASLRSRLHSCSSAISSHETPTFCAIREGIFNDKCPLTYLG
eukprot:COSAG01_NODE_1815_length_9170_cov_35.104509_5_plen_145_part_00